MNSLQLACKWMREYDISTFTRTQFQDTLGLSNGATTYTIRQLRQLCVIRCANTQKRKPSHACDDARGRGLALYHVDLDAADRMLQQHGRPSSDPQTVAEMPPGIATVCGRQVFPEIIPGSSIIAGPYRLPSEEWMLKRVIADFEAAGEDVTLALERDHHGWGISVIRV